MVGTLYDGFGNYRVAIYVCAALTILSSGLTLMLGKYRYASH
jgi:cyanate permease